MNLNELQDHWDALGKNDPLRAILSRDNRKDGAWKIEEFLKTGEREIDAVLEDLHSLGITIPLKKALDFGCGIGRLTQALAGHFQEVAGVDIAPSMIELANQYNRYGNKCRYILNQVNDLTIFPDEYFNFIYSVITLQHMQPKYAMNYIKEFLRILAPGGVMVFHIPSETLLRNDNGTINWQGFILRIMPKSFLDATYRKIRYGNRPRMEIFVIKKQLIVDFLNRNGGRIISIQQTRGPVLMDCRYFVARD